MNVKVRGVKITLNLKPKIITQPKLSTHTPVHELSDAVKQHCENADQAAQGLWFKVKGLGCKGLRVMVV